MGGRSCSGRRGPVADITGGGGMPAYAGRPIAIARYSLDTHYRLKHNHKIGSIATELITVIYT